MRVGQRGGRPAALGHEPPLGRPQLWVGQKSKGDGGGENFFFFFFFLQTDLLRPAGLLRAWDLMVQIWQRGRRADTVFVKV